MAECKAIFTKARLFLVFAESPGVVCIQIIDAEHKGEKHQNNTCSF